MKNEPNVGASVHRFGVLRSCKSMVVMLLNQENQRHLTISP